MASKAAPRAKCTSPFEPLELTRDEAETLEQLSRVILRNYMEQFEAFESESGGVVDERVWKQMKQREGVRAFVERKKHSDSGANDIRLSVESFAGSGAMLPPDLPVMLAVGSIPGVLDDLMYGLMGSTTEEVRVRAVYTGDYTDDTAVLTTLATPTQEDPFLSFTLRWEHHDTGHGILRPAVSDRDFVLMERTGLAFTSSGERLGFHLLHSVHFPQTPELPGLIRANTSVCGIYRNNAALNRVDLFVRGITDARGSMIRLAVIIASADQFVTIAKYMESSCRKKLMRRLRQARKTSASLASSSGPSESRSKSGTKKTCAVCNKTPSVTALVSGGGLRSCVLCSKRVCSSCQIKKTLSQVTSASGELEQRKFTFCSACFNDVCRSDALSIAQAEAADEAKESIESFSKWSSNLSPISSE